MPQDLQKQVAQRYALFVMQKQILKEVSQGFTRYQVRLYPVLFVCDQFKEISGFEWLSYVSLKQLAFSSGHRRIFQQLDDSLQPV